MKQDSPGRTGPTDAAGDSPQRLAMLLSALADGEAADPEADEACLAWRDGSACATWHAYQMIGDVLRSEDLAAEAGADAAFVRRLRGRLADEPVVLAPAAEVAPPWRLPRRAAGGGHAAAIAWRRWSAPAAMAAGVLAVAGVAVMVRNGGTPVSAAPATLAAASAAEPSAQLAQAGDEQAPAMLVRDAQLDRYLAAHRQYTGRSLLVEPQSLRQAMVALPLDR